MCIVPLVVFGEHRDNLRNSQSVFLKSQYTVELVGKGF